MNAQNISASATGFSNLPVLRQLGLLIGLAASIALGGYVIMSLQSPTYTLLYSNLSPRDSSEVVDALSGANIPFEINNNTGAIMVAADKLHEARIKLAMDGLPNSNSMGFELLEKKRNFGTSQFMETARYQRALEGELSRSISTLSGVQKARVHLAIPKQSAFIRNRKPPSASVLVDLFSGRNLNEGQVAAIVHLVASSIPNLQPDSVTVVDKSGRLLTRSGDSDGLMQTAKQFDYIRRMEQAYIKRIEDLLSPLVGPGGVRAQVVADLDFTQTEKTHESFNPDLPAVRSEQTLKEQSGANGRAAGVPGALSNQAPNQENRPQQNRTVKSETIRSTKNYEIDRTVSHTKLASGRIKRITVAVVLDNKTIVDADGNIQSVALKEEELSKFTNLVKEAIGFDQRRGDRVNIVNAAFTPAPKLEPLPETPIWQQAWVWNGMKQVFIPLVILILGYGILRPVMRSLAQKAAIRPAESPMLAANVQEGVVNQGQNNQVNQLAGGQNPALASQAMGGTANPFGDKLNTAKSMVQEDPKRVAKVVKTWIATDD